MAAKEFTLKGVLKFFDDGASKTIKSVSAAVNDLKVNAKRVSGGFKDFTAGLAVVGAGGAAVTAGLGSAVKQAMDFEQSMANLNSVNELTSDQFRRIELEALKLGSSTVFSASEAVAGMTELTKAGLTVDQTLSAIPGVLAAAATEGIELAKASEIVVGIMQGQNLEMNQATRVADVLAKTANSTASGILDLGEAFKYANTLSQQGLTTFEETATALGLLSNAGLKGSVAGTSLVAMFNQITNPSKKVQTAFGGMSNMMALFTDESGKLKTMPEILAIISKAADRQNNQFQRMRFLTDLVGVEGAKAFGGLLANMKQVGADGKNAYDALLEANRNAAGAADDMSKKRLNTLSGVLTIVHHEIAAIGIMIGKQFIPGLREGADEVMGFVRSVAKTFLAFNKSFHELTAEDIQYMNSPMGQFIQGFKEGLGEAITAVRGFVTYLSDRWKELSGGTAEGNRELGKSIAKFLMLAAVVGPVLVGFAAMIFVVGTIAQGFFGLFSIMRGGVGIILTLAKHGWVLLKWLFILGGKALPLVATGLKAVGSGMVWLVTNPIGLTILALGALVFAGWYLYKNWDAVILGIKAMWSSLKNFIKTAGIGELILKTLLFPIRMAFTPLMEIVKFLSSTSLAKRFIDADTLSMISGFAEKVSLLPGKEDFMRLDAEGGGPKLAPPTSPTAVPARDVESGALEQTGLGIPFANAGAVNVNVQPAAVDAKFDITVELDKEKVGRKMGQLSVENTERLGGSFAPKEKTRLNTGMFAIPQGG